MPGIRPLPRLLHSTRQTQQFHFDTHFFVKRLEEEGLSRQQAVGIMTALEDTIDESIKNMVANLVTRTEQEKVSPPPPRVVACMGKRGVALPTREEGGPCPGNPYRK
jgi:Protein of unknown function (DUF1640)